MREFGTKKTIKEEVTDLAIYDASDEQLVPVTEKVCFFKISILYLWAIKLT